MSKRQKSWDFLKKCAEKGKGQPLKQLFADDKKRFEKYSLHVGPILFDYSKNLITDEVMGGLLNLAHEVGVSDWRERMFSGGHINTVSYTHLTLPTKLEV
ncbi:MAG: hypothetical protein KUG56_05915 [Kordiimonadaceae bacterium]|nr:hypothetical protein [Kordiimonadaceae bacterium]